MQYTKIVDGQFPFFPQYIYMKGFIDPNSEGIEIGASAHNAFWLELTNCLNVAPDDSKDFELYKAEQVRLCGRYAEVDVWAEGDNLPFEDGSKQYVLSSHSFEHFPDPIKAIKEWDRVLAPNGIVVLIVPIKGAAASDASRPIITLAQAQEAYAKQLTVDNWVGEPVARRGHYYVYTPEALKEIVDSCTHWEIVGEEARDSKVGNGFALIFRKPLLLADVPPVMEVVPVAEVAPPPKPKGRPRKS